VARGRELLDEPDARSALFAFLEAMAGAQQVDRALFEAVADTLLANPDIRAAHVEVIGVLDSLLTRAQAAGEVREDVGAVDVLMLMKGACHAAAEFTHIDPDIVHRQVDLVLASLRPAEPDHGLRGRAATLEDLERAFPVVPPAAEASS
jgi:hypothetical protein